MDHHRPAKDGVASVQHQLPGGISHVDLTIHRQFTKSPSKITSFTAVCMHVDVRVCEKVSECMGVCGCVHVCVCMCECMCVYMYVRCKCMHV